MKDETGDVIHSSTYANAQNGGTIGATSGESFEARRAVDAQRTFVRGYGDSRVGRGTVNRMSAKKYEPGESGAMAGGGVGIGGASIGTGGASGGAGNNSGNNAPRLPMRRNPGISR